MTNNSKPGILPERKNGSFFQRCKNFYSTAEKKRQYLKLKTSG